MRWPQVAGYFSSRDQQDTTLPQTGQVSRPSGPTGCPTILNSGGETSEETLVLAALLGKGTRTGPTRQTDVLEQTDSPSMSQDKETSHNTHRPRLKTE